MPRYQFPGPPAFLDAAAAENGRPEAALAARRDSTLNAVASLCAQAADGQAGHVAGILAEAERCVDRLRAALGAAEQMIEHVRLGRADAPQPEAAPLSPIPPLRRGGRHV